VKAETSNEQLLRDVYDAKRQFMPQSVRLVLSSGHRCWDDAGPNKAAVTWGVKVYSACTFVWWRSDHVRKLSQELSSICLGKYSREW